MGVGWTVVLGDWLSAAGPLGTVVGFLIGGSLLTLVAACYAELATTTPLAGGEVVYLDALFGPTTAFLVSWFLVLVATAITGFEAISIAWFMDRLFPGHQGPVLYSLLGSDIHAGALIIGVIGVLLIALTNHVGVGASGRLQSLFTYTKAVAIVVFVLAACLFGDAHPLQPRWPSAAPGATLLGIGWIAATTPMWLAGFQVVPQAVEERNATTSLAQVGRLTVLSVLLGVLFYCSVVLAAARAVPWQELMRMSLPAVPAVEAVVPGAWLSRAALLAIVLGIVATWNSAFLWATRLLYSLGRAGHLPRAFASLGRFQSPAAAALVVTGIGLGSVFLGRGVLLPIVSMGSMGFTISFVVTCAATLRQRRLRPDQERPYQVPGGVWSMRIALVGSVLMGIYGLLEPWLHSHALPIEWVLMAVWLMIGLGLLRQRRSRRST